MCGYGTDEVDDPGGEFGGVGYISWAGSDERGGGTIKEWTVCNVASCPGVFPLE